MSASRRDFIGQAALAAVGATLSARIAQAADQVRQPGSPLAGFFNLNHGFDSVTVTTAAADLRLVRSGPGHWSADGILVTSTDVPGAIRVRLSAPSAAIKRIHLRWRGRVSDTSRVLGDAWERGYGDLEWRGLVPDRVMPWYVAIRDGAATHCFGVRTGPRAFCYWQVDAEGMSLIADVRSGGVGVELKDRILDVCDIVSRGGHPGESSFAAIHAFCREMCANPRLPAAPVFGSNDWYWAYGRNTAATVLTDAHNLVDLAPPIAAAGNRPIAVIDDGWQPFRGMARTDVGAWDRGNEKFPDMPGLAAEVKRAGARPGIWIRPLLATAQAPDSWRLMRDKQFFDPTVPEVREKVAADFARLRQWGFELIKHDYSTFDLFGRWGYQMGAATTRDGWAFASGTSKTSAEVIDELYRTIREASGDALIIGCNTVSHLSAGHFEICRVGDDTSGTEWSRTRKMGVNSLAFRGPQHGAFYVADADCVGVTNAVPWSFNRQWLDLLARSGTMLFVSLAPDALGAEQKKDLKTAFALASEPHALGEPLDWERNVYPSRWRLLGVEKSYDWVGPDGVG